LTIILNRLERSLQIKGSTSGTRASRETLNAKEMWEAIKSRFGVNDESKKRTKPGVDTLSFDDLYNNLRVFKYDLKGSTVSSSSIYDVTFVSFDNTSSTNEVNTGYGVSTSFGNNSQKEGSSLYADDLI
nr:hypothetical protein [Tanacetum cinerariifolium]